MINELSPALVATACHRCHDYVIDIVLIRSRVANMPSQRDDRDDIRGHRNIPSWIHHQSSQARPLPKSRYPVLSTLGSASTNPFKRTELRRSFREKSVIVDDQPKVGFRPSPGSMGLTSNSL
jgi:hypothetical protein